MLQKHEDAVTMQVRRCRWEAHIWVGKGVNKQLYLGGYESVEAAAQAYDIATLKVKGSEAATNFNENKCGLLQLVIPIMLLHQLNTSLFLCSVLSNFRLLTPNWRLGASVASVETGTQQRSTASLNTGTYVHVAVYC